MATIKGIKIIRHFQLNGKAVELFLKVEPYGYSVGYQVGEKPIEIAGGFLTMRAAVKQRDKLEQLLNDLGATPQAIQQEN